MTEQKQNLATNKTASNAKEKSGVNQDSDIENRPIRIGISLPTQAYFLSGIRDFTLNLIKNMTDFSEQWAYRFQSVVDELCNNAIEHGSMPGEEIKITFISTPHQSVEIFVEDTGTVENHLKAKAIEQIVKERREQNTITKTIRGRGLSKIVAEWADELEFKDTSRGGIEVRIKKYLENTKMHDQQTLEKPTHIMLN